MPDYFEHVLSSSYWGEYEVSPSPARKSVLLSSLNMPARRMHRAGRIIGDALLENLAGAETLALNPGVIINPLVNSVANYELPGAVIAVDEEILTVTALPSGSNPLADLGAPMTNWEQTAETINRSRKWPLIRSIAGQSISEFLRESVVKRAENHDISQGFSLRPTFHLHATASRPGLIYHRGVRLLSVVEGWPKKVPDVTELRWLKYDGEKAMRAKATLARQQANPNGSTNRFLDIVGEVGYDILPMTVGETVYYPSGTLPRYTLRRIARAEILRGGSRVKATSPKFANHRATSPAA